MIQRKQDEIIGFVKAHTNIDYCICGSGLSFLECCDKPLNSNLHRYLDDSLYAQTTKGLRILYSKKGDAQMGYAKRVICGLYKKLEKMGLFSKCICPGCMERPIRSHLFPRSFLHRLQEENYIFTMEGVEGGLGPNSFQMSLLCGNTDKDLFEQTDRIGDMMEVFNLFLHEGIGNEQQSEQEVDKARLIGEFGAKTFFFKFKTYVLEHMRYFYQGLLVIDLVDQEEKEKYLLSFLKSYIKYQKILAYFNKNFFEQDGAGRRMIRIPYMDGKTWAIRGKPGGTSPFPNDELLYLSNIKFVEGIPVYIVSMLKNGVRVFFIGITVEDSLKEESEMCMGELYQIIKGYKDKEDVNGAFEWVNEFALRDNPIFYISPQVGYMGTTYIHGRKSG